MTDQGVRGDFCLVAKGRKELSAYLPARLSSSGTADLLLAWLNYTNLERQEARAYYTWALGNMF